MDLTMHLKTYTPHKIRKAANDFGIPYKVALFSRKRALLSWVKKQEENFVKVGDAPYIPWQLEDIRQAKKEIAAITTELNREEDKTGEITENMIEKARNYPIEQLFEFNKGNALAFCHKDTHPSLSWDKKRNRVRCFVCNKSFDTIAVLMQRDNFTFTEAVKRLQG